MKSVHILVLACIIYIVISAAFGYYINIKKYDNLLDFSVSRQEHMLDNIVAEFKALSDDETENPEILDNMFKDKNVYGFVYKENVVIYEMNMETTEKYQYSTTRELFNDYSLDSGSTIVDDAANIMLKDAGTEYLTKNIKNGKEIVSWKTVSKGGYSYVVGVTCLVESILDMSNYYLYRNLTALSCLINYLIVILLCFYIVNIKKKMAV